MQWAIQIIRVGTILVGLYNQRLKERDMKLDHVSLCAQRKIVLTLLVAVKMAV